MMKRMICFDIDGTLLTSKKKLNPGAVAAIGKLTENPDNILAIATGRGPYMFKEIR
ncbi:MAG: HAD hydrolase family protein [Bacillales bacterium]|nr:HAD hydrolase family protein [Bacillales bacterium]